MHPLFENITADIVAAIEEGAGAYEMPWRTGGRLARPQNGITGRTYRGINTLVLWARANRAHYSSPRWATFRQWSASGATIRKGEKSTTIVFWKHVEAPSPAHTDGQSDSEDTGIGRPMARAFQVFNENQVEGFEPPSPEPLQSLLANPIADDFVGRMNAQIWHGSDEAFYDPRSDTISMPAFEQFKSPEGYYSVLAHELVHWSGAKARLDRNLSTRFGSDAYAIEELVAELGAAFVTAHLNIDCTPRTDHAPYIQGWLRVLKSDARAIVAAASKAQLAADYLIGLAKTKATETPSISRTAIQAELTL